MEELSKQRLLDKIKELERKLEEVDYMIEAIKDGQVDAFAIRSEHDKHSEIYTLQSGDYAYRVLIEEFQEGAINVTEEGLIVYTNTYFFELLQLPYEAVIGSSMFDFVDAGSRDTFNDIFTKGLQGKSKGEINLSVNETIIPVYVSLTSLQPRLPTVGIIITDLTQKKKDEEVLLKYQTDLESKNTALLHSNAELASFAYIASHDLQEPLRKIQTFSSRLVEKEVQHLSESGKDYFGRMQKSVRRMQTLIDDLLLYSRTNTTERKFEKTDLSQLVQQVKEELREELSLKNATVEASGLGSITIIPFQFRQLLHNLLSNALKFSNPEIAPLITIKSDFKKGVYFNVDQLSAGTDYCHLSISDNGIGFEQQYSEKIFELFQRLHGKSEYNGTGIGLAIVKKIVENHHGVICAKSALKKGATFDIYIPVKQITQ